MVSTTPDGFAYVCSHHFHELVALVQVRHDDTLTLRHRPICADELAVFSHLVNLIERQLVRVQIARGERAAVFQHLV